MNLSTKGRFGLKALVDLAELQKKNQSSVTLKEIAARQEISLKYLELIFTTLKNAGFVKSQRGLKGGYTLGRPTSGITVMEVIMAFESPNLLMESQPELHQCGGMASLKLNQFWQKVHTQMAEEFCNTTLQALL